MAVEPCLSSATIKADALRRLDAFGLRRTQMGYYYIAHYFPLRAMDDVDPQQAKAMLRAVSTREFELYFHIPFCEVRCAFCHFYKEVAAKHPLDIQRKLVDQLIAELRIVRSIVGPIYAKSVYFGGGTPSVLDNTLLDYLLTEVSKLITVAPGAEIKFEIYPKKYAGPELNEKLDLLKAFGVTDIVVDIESGNSAALKRVGRGNSSWAAFESLLEMCAWRGFDSIVTALMIGMPHETTESLLRTLRTLVSIPQIKIINTFPFITREPDAIAAMLSKSPEGFNTAYDRDLLCIVARDFLLRAGFTEGPIAYFRRPGKRAEQQGDKFECVNLLGIGPSAFSYLNGDDWAAQTFNFCTTQSYSDRVAGGFPGMWRAGVMGQEERARRKIIFGLANCKTESLVEVERVFGVSVDAILGRELNALLQLNLIEVDQEGEGIRYTDLGLHRLEEISYFLGSKFVKDKCAQPVEDGSFSTEIRRHHYYIDVLPDDRARFERFSAEFDTNFMWRLDMTRHESFNRVVLAALPSRIAEESNELT